jgi:hypothetical protein
MTPDIILSVFPDLPEKLAGDLCEPFAQIEARFDGAV